jgi:Ca2+-dependent lipid-binding protein
VPNANLGKETTLKTEATQSGEQYREAQDETAPPAPMKPGSTTDVPIRGAAPSNILFHPTPSVSYEPMFAMLESRNIMLCTGIFLAIVFVGRMFGGKLLGLIPLAMCVTSALWLFNKEVIRSGRETEWHSEKERGQTATANLIPESVEWLNSMWEVGWKMVNPEMFTAVADTLEDVMQASVPGVIENIRVAEINQGSNPIRVLSLRSLPDSHVQEMKDFIHAENKKVKDPQEAAADEEGGDYYNLEAAIAYHALPSGERVSDRARNMHMQMVFYLGIKGLFGIPLPIFVELQSLVATVRLRLQMTREPPFLKTLTFTLMGVPHVQAGCVPMFERGVNLLNLPLISNFVNYAIGAAASMYVAPKSMILDMRAMLQGDDITKDVHALGVLWIRIHRAVGLSKQDRRGSKYGGSDPYITLAFSKYSKPMYCTRVITDDLQPIFEESLALLVTPELIQADENLSVELWDSDRHSADDIVGKVELSIQKMIQHPGKMFPQVSKLAGMDAGSDMPGELHWELGYFQKPSFRPALRTDGKNNALPKELRDDPKFQDEQGTANTDQEAAAQFTPPDPLWPSGVVSVIVHQIVNLELENIKGTTGNRKNREFEPAKPFGEATEEQGSRLPTSYCTICLNDELVYRTRAKAVSSQPIFNAGTERFIRDWKSAIVTVTVRDQRNRQHDPILGVVPLKLSEILDNRSQVTRWFPLDGGIGFGRVRISLLFRSTELKLSPNMLGWDVGTFEFAQNNIIRAEGYDANTRIKLRTGGSVGDIPRNLCEKSGNGVSWDLSKDTTGEIRLPVKYRYRSPVVFEFHTAGKRKADAYATFWLQQLVDNEETDIDIPIWTTSQPQRLIQNYITESNCQSEPGLEDIKEVGRLKFRARFKAGMDESHGRFVADNDARETYETWEACLAEGVRERIVEKEIPEQVQQLHEKSLTEGRDVLKGDGKRWKTKDGTDWSGAFGKDPAQYAVGGSHNVHEDDDTFDEDDSTDVEDTSSGTVDLGIQDAGNPPDEPGRLSTTSNTTTASGSMGNVNKQNKRTEERKHRGLNQWKPVRNAVFAKDQSMLGLAKLKKKITGGLDGRQPGVESGKLFIISFTIHY